ncbi:hypothetical protein Pse7367_2449 [Thalassoporum mexicanum PCC 7367]|uniref:hypothetical protein n=1 Tax=Thalassoporum mexicanum TaxID=3457544 RepID=UPI00029FD0CB|nr:hypothetical protein [Pseudanabaena sp. PCC 7367]AFY70710.1 hypothetical protein Pse7367_2449 [Pseudanabaena sp. PCC 7367]
MEEKAGKCRHCGEIEVRRSRRRYIYDYPLSWVGIYPYRCAFCVVRCYKLGRDRYVAESIKSSVQLVKPNQPVSQAVDG